MYSEERLQAEEYEIQHYGFSSTELTEDFSELVKHRIETALNEVENTLLEENDDKVVARKQIQDLRELYLKKIDNPLKKFRNTAQQIFEIHPNVLLESDTIYKEPHTPEQVVELRREVEALEKEYTKERLFLQRCKEQMEIIKKLKPISDATNVKLKTVPSVMKSEEHVKSIKKLFQSQRDSINYCLDEKSATHAKYYSKAHLFPAKD